MERLQGVIAQAVYMDPGIKHNAERARALGEAMLNLNRFSLFSTRIWEWNLKSVYSLRGVIWHW